MAKGAKLKAALDRYKGVDHKLEHQKKLQKQAEKKKLKQQRDEVDIEELEVDGGAEETGDAQDLANDPVLKALVAEAAKAAEEANGEAERWQTDESGDAEEEEDDDGDEDDDEDGDEDEEEGGVGLGTFEDESDSDSDEDGDDTFYTAAGGSPEKKAKGTEAGDDDEEEEEEDIPLSDIESLASEDRADVIPHQRLTINNTAALQRSLKSFALPSDLPFVAVQSVTTAEPVEIADVEDDINRELAFYRQSLEAVKEARIKLKKEGVPFTRPADYFAEMVKSEEQMGKVRQKMVDEAARKKASADARRQRDLKKFGKAVQVAKTQERAKEKRDTLDKINALKRSEFYSPLTPSMHYVLTRCNRTSRRRAFSQRGRSLRRRARGRGRNRSQGS
jgi:rRNA-processing protein EBP2